MFRQIARFKREGAALAAECGVGAVVVGMTLPRGCDAGVVSETLAALVPDSGVTVAAWALSALAGMWMASR